MPERALGPNMVHTLLSRAHEFEFSLIYNGSDISDRNSTNNIEQVNFCEDEIIVV